MTFQPGANLYTQGFGSRPENVEAPHIDVRAPNANDILYPVGKKWTDTVGNASYELTSFSASGNITTANWQNSSGGSGQLSSLSGDSGTATPSGGSIKIAGTSNQITTAASGSTVTLSLPSAVTFPGSATATTSLAAGTTVTAGTGITSTTGNIVATAGAVNAGTTMTAGTGITATTGNITATAGNLISTVGNLQLNGATNSVKINAASPTTSAVGFVTLSGAATTTLTSSAITANSIILFSLKTLGTLTASAITYTTTGGSATITPAGSTDTSTYGYLIIN